MTDQLREWRIDCLIAPLPGRVQRSVRWLRRPSSRWARIPASGALMAGACLAILPVFGLWMAPLGLIILAEDVPALRRITDGWLDWLERKRPRWFDRSSHRFIIQFRDLSQSWDRNAGNWTRVVRGGQIPSRRAGTDVAVLDAIAECMPARLLDIGCGEGWLIRAAAERAGCMAVGIDGAAELIAAARAADPTNRYAVLNYDSFAAGVDDIGADFDIAVFNYALFDEDIVPLLTAAAARLKPGGTIVIQTLHPGGLDEDGWQVEDFSAFGGANWTPMPWYARGMASWQAAVRAAGLELRDLRAPRAADGRILSLLLVAGKAS